MAIYQNNKIEFDLVIKKSVDKNSNFEPYPRMEKVEPDYEIVEELKYKSISAVEVIRKLLDYIK